MHNIYHFTTTYLATALLTRRISSVEALEAHLAQIARHNPTLNAVVTLDEEGARRRAREADEALARGEVWGLLHGVPVTLKDGHSTAGMRTTAGHPPLADYVPAEDGTVAARLKGAGAIIMGKTNVSPLLGDIQTYNDIFGTTNNPYNPERTPGGSSGGAAVALAVGMTPLEIGSDFAGSIRIPAHFCGVFGLKPTEHLVSMRGHIPDVPSAVRSHRTMWSIGPLARSIEDLDLGMRIIAGPDGWDPDVSPVPIGERPRFEPKQLRIAWAPTFPGVPVARSTESALRKLAGDLESAGIVVEEALPAIDFGELARTRAFLSRGVRLAFNPDTDEGPPPSLAEYYTALHHRDAFTRECERFLTTWDALICPVAMRAAFPHCPTETPIDVDGEAVSYWRVIGHTAPFNFTGHPVVVVPVGKDEDGLPIGVQVVGKRWGEARLLGVAEVVVNIAGMHGQLALPGE